MLRQQQKEDFWLSFSRKGYIGQSYVRLCGQATPLVGQAEACFSIKRNVSVAVGSDDLIDWWKICIATPPRQ